MKSVTNNTRETLNFIVGAKDGEPVTDHVRAGETKAIDIDPEHPFVQAHIAAGAITVAQDRPTKAKAATDA